MGKTQLAHPIVVLNTQDIMPKMGRKGSFMGRKNRSLEAKHKKAKMMAVESGKRRALDQSAFELRMGDWKPLKSSISTTPKIKYSELNGDDYDEFRAKVAKDLISRVPSITGKLQKLHQAYA